ncbi:hypothetical protein WJ970_07015 [Achromobacter xylosoxidans]
MESPRTFHVLVPSSARAVDASRSTLPDGAGQRAAIAQAHVQRAAGGDDVAVQRRSAGAQIDLPGFHHRDDAAAGDLGRAYVQQHAVLGLAALARHDVGIFQHHTVIAAAHLQADAVLRINDRAGPQRERIIRVGAGRVAPDSVRIGAHGTDAHAVQGK